MKKLIVYVICAAMLLSFAACSGGGDDTTTDVLTEPLTTEPETTDMITEEPATDTETEEETTVPIFTDPSEEVLNTPAATQFTVSRVFGNDMVIQRNEYIRVWERTSRRSTLERTRRLMDALADVLRDR